MIEKIQGEAILKLFKELQQDKTPLTMQSINDDYERLSHIADIRKWKGLHYFLIEYHEGFLKAGHDFDDWKLRFQFIGKDKINHTFETGSGEISRKMIWIRLPEIIHRCQRRRLFRLEAPHGTRLYFKIFGTHYKLLVINISLGGTLGVLVSLTKSMEQDLHRFVPKMLENAELVFHSKENNDDSKVNIRQCQIKRQHRNPQTKKYECAIEFKEIAEVEQEKLRRLFYQCQRDYLQKRRQLKA